MEIKQSHLSWLVAAVVALGIVIVFTMLPGSEVNRLRIRDLFVFSWKVFLWIAGAVIVYVLPIFLGIAAALGINFLDQRVDERQHLGIIAHISTALGAGFVYSQIHTLIVQIVVSSGWGKGIHDTVLYFMTQGSYKLDRIVYETPSVNWMIYAGIALAVSYFVTTANLPTRDSY